MRLPSCLLGLVLVTGHSLASALPRLNRTEHDLLKRQEIEHTKPEWMIVRRLAPWHLQQLAAGEKKDVGWDSKEHMVDFLRGAGDGVDIYVFDSGIRLSHVAFLHHFETEGGPSRASNFKDTQFTEYIPRDETWDDLRGHGTHVAGLAGGVKHGVAASANLVNVKIEHCRTVYTTTEQGERKEETQCESDASGFLQAIKDVIDRHEEKKKNPPEGWKGSVINMSLGIVKETKSIHRAIERAYKAGIPIAVAAGNRPSGLTVLKAEGMLCKSPYTICVGATSRTYRKSDVSRDGPYVDIWAPGNSVVSADIGPNKNDNHATVGRTGTSMACPLVAGIMATIVGYEGPLTEDKNTSFVYQRLLANALPGVMQNMAPDEKNLFAQTGINHVKRVPPPPPPPGAKQMDQPYGGVPNDFFNYNEYSVQLWRKRGNTEPEEVGYRTTYVENGDPNNPRPLVFFQEPLNVQTEPYPGDDTWMPEILGGDDEAPEEEEEGPGGSGPAPPPPPPPPPPPQPKPLCQGNQIYEDCEGGKLQHDMTGQQGPVCMKADGTPGSPARLNEQKLREAATGYCRELVDAKWLFKEGAPTPRAPSLAGQAQDGKSMSIAAMYHKGSCAEGKSEMSMAEVGLEGCVMNLSMAVTSVCAIGPTWGDKWVKDFEILGGVYAVDCIMYSAFGGQL